MSLQKEKALNLDLIGILCNEEKQRCLKSRSLWLKFKDNNTKYFHNQAHSHVHQNRFKQIIFDNGETLNTFKEIKKSASNRFKYLYIEDGDFDESSYDLFIQSILELVTFEDSVSLSKYITKEEVSKEIWSLEPNKNPGPYGFTIHLYRACWDIIKFDLC